MLQRTPAPSVPNTLLLETSPHILTREKKPQSSTVSARPKAPLSGKKVWISREKNTFVNTFSFSFLYFFRNRKGGKDSKRGEERRRERGELILAEAAAKRRDI